MSHRKRTELDKELEEYRQWLDEQGDKLAPLPDLRGVDFRGADLSEAGLSDDTLRKADLSGVNIRDAGRPVETDRRDQHGREG